MNYPTGVKVYEGFAQVSLLSYAYRILFNRYNTDEDAIQHALNCVRNALRAGYLPRQHITKRSKPLPCGSVHDRIAYGEKEDGWGDDIEGHFTVTYRDPITTKAHLKGFYIAKNPDPLSEKYQEVLQKAISFKNETDKECILACLAKIQDVSDTIIKTIPVDFTMKRHPDKDLLMYMAYQPKLVLHTNDLYTPMTYYIKNEIVSPTPIQGALKTSKAMPALRLLAYYPQMELLNPKYTL